LEFSEERRPDFLALDFRGGEIALSRSEKKLRFVVIGFFIPLHYIIVLIYYDFVPPVSGGFFYKFMRLLATCG
jgi:hypothetical protein